jgi:HPt (histidine-containing phosphotransfer) domain-containing protein
MLTSAGQRGDAARCRAIGMEGYLTKPVRESDLRDALRAVLREGVAAGGTTLVTRHALREGRGGAVPSIAGGEEAIDRPPVASHDAPIDPVDLLGRVEGDHALLSELVRAFLTTAPAQMSQIDAAIERGEGAAVVRAAHTLRGSVGTFGAVPARAAAQLEDCGDRATWRRRGARQCSPPRWRAFRVPSPTTSKEADDEDPDRRGRPGLAQDARGDAGALGIRGRGDQRRRQKRPGATGVRCPKVAILD